MNVARFLFGAALAAAVFPFDDAHAAEISPNSLKSVASAFGARPYAEDPSLSADGKRLIFISPGAQQMNMAVVLDLANGDTKTITYADGKPLKLTYCGWSASDRVVCQMYGVSKLNGIKMSWSRLVGLGIDGKDHRELGSFTGEGGANQYDGHVLDWMSGIDSKLLISRGGKVELVDTRSGKGEAIQPPVADGWTDGEGHVRIIGITGATGRSTYHYRSTDGNDWKIFGHGDVDGNGLTPLAVDGAANVAYATQKLNGRAALYKVALDGTMKTELIFSDAQFDVDGIETIGRHSRVIGLRYATDRVHIVYFDPIYQKLAVDLAKGLPNLPQIRFVSASTDEKRLLVFASSDVDPGHYFLLDRETRKLTEVLRSRPALAGLTLGAETSITYKASDGMVIPAYLTLPPGSSGRNLPAIVLPHGGPAERDYWGFDWIAQFFAQRGFAVIQPQFRGSTGYGDAFFQKNGFQSWRTSIGDVTDAGRWLIAQGIADPAKLAIFGWSYGGYAALQSNVIDPNLFKVVVAVAPVTDLGRLKSQAENFTNYGLVSKFIGSGPSIEQGSPDNYAKVFRAPVLMFHGDMDINVDVSQSKLMNEALRRAGKQSTLVIFPGLDHQLDDSQSRSMMLVQADTFLRDALKIGGR